MSRNMRKKLKNKTIATAKHEKLDIKTSKSKNTGFSTKLQQLLQMFSRRSENRNNLEILIYCQVCSNCYKSALYKSSMSSERPIC